MKKQDRSLKLKGFQQVDPKMTGAIISRSCVKDNEGNAVKIITRCWKKLRNEKKQ